VPHSLRVAEGRIFLAEGEWLAIYSATHMQSVACHRVPWQHSSYGQTRRAIALISRKGGTGKSTLAIGLAVAAMEAGHRVCLLEADPLGTVSNWRRRRTAAEPTVETVHDGYVLFHRVQALAHRGVTLTFVDTAGGWSDACRGAMAAADFCLIPARPSPADIEAAAPTLAAVRESGKPFAFVLNQVQARSTRLNGAAGGASTSGCETRFSRAQTHRLRPRISSADFPRGAYSVMPSPTPSASC
jgi:cellulose biosynthesis protein BcsQ